MSLITPSLLMDIFVWSVYLRVVQPYPIAFHASAPRSHVVDIAMSYKMLRC